MSVICCNKSSYSSEVPPSSSPKEMSLPEISERLIINICSVKKQLTSCRPCRPYPGDRGRRRLHPALACR